MRERQRAVRSDIITDVERPWIELVDEFGVIVARDALLAAGVTSESFAASVACWLYDQGKRRRAVSGETGRRYRRVLEVLEPPDRDRLRAIPG